LIRRGPRTELWTPREFDERAGAGKPPRSAPWGRGVETACVTGEELDKAGNVEMRTWITLLDAVGAARAEVVCYEPSWHHGNAVVTWPVAPSGSRP